MLESIHTDPKDENQATRQAVIRLFNDTRRKLVETGTRNRLVHVNRTNTRSKVLNIVNERSDDVYACLSSGKSMQFLALGHDDEKDRGDIILADANQDGFDEGRYTDTQLETKLGPNALQKKLLKIAHEAQTAEEESGINMLYLAMGFLTWFEDKLSNLPREAPLVLLPVELVRNAKTSTYDIHLREDDLLTNLPLQQRLREDFGIDLPELETSEEWKPSNYFDQVRDVILTHPRWDISPNAIQLGFFSFKKLLMYRDLSIDAWPNDALANHGLVKGLLYEGFRNDDPLFGRNDRLDDVLPPEKLFHVVDADASQAKVIEEARSGRNLVVQGPPGTGKSQTITNIIAAAAIEGKRVLFVAEKMAALSVVHDRLVKAGLRDICLELHARNANKKSVLGELSRTLSQASAVPDMPNAPTALKNSRDLLNDLEGALHHPIGETGETPYSVLGRQSLFIGRNCPPPSLEADSLRFMSQETEAKLLTVIEEYGTLLAPGGQGSPHPFEGVRNLDLQPVDLARLSTKLLAAQTAITALISAMQAPIEALSLPHTVTFNALPPLLDLLKRLEGLPNDSDDAAMIILSASDMPRVQECLRAGASWHKAYEDAETCFVDTAFSTPVARLRGPLIAGANSFFTRWGNSYRDASRDLAGLLRRGLPKAAFERVQLVDQLTEIVHLKSTWESDQGYCSRILGDIWRGERTDFSRLLAAADWCARLTDAPLKPHQENAVRLATKTDTLATIRQSLHETEPRAHAASQAVEKLLDLDPSTFGVEKFELVDLGALAARFGAMAEALEQYTSWTRLARTRKLLISSGLSALEERMRAGDLNGHSAAIELRYARAEMLWKLALAQNPVLHSIDQVHRHDLVANFTSLGRQHLKNNATRILAGHLAQIPQGAMGEMKVIRGEIGKKRNHIALRRLFETAGTAIQRIKPVLLMSPISVAQFLPPGTVSFDLLVIDEASQIRPEDALGAITRANQIVIVGDKEQLPPSSFFDRLLADETDDAEDEEGERADLLQGAAKIESMESVLTLCEARGLETRMLMWHYRSRDPSLIAVSNHEFYRNNLILPPSPLQRDPAYGLCLTQVDGIYDRGGKRDNRKEGESVVDRVAEHARINSSHSLGVVTFSSAQRNLITELLELRRRHDATLDAFLHEGKSEDFFVKNIENVQGDERDVILISVGYGPSIPGGRLSSMSFGPVNSDGGERRLNVLFTRARIRCEIFASFDPGDMDLKRTTAAGPRVLKRFLEYAKNGQLEEFVPTGEGADSPFEEDVASVIQGFGFLADPQVGSAGFRIDLGIRHPDKPGTYILAVECDGATYHSALWARERDRLRQDVLEHLGWRFHRIWSTDWFYNRPAEIERLRAALFMARDEAEQGLEIKGANDTYLGPDTQDEESPAIEIPDVNTRQMPVYERAIFSVRSSLEPHEIPVSTLAGLVRKIVHAEGPIHLDEIARRLATCFGKEKAGSRIVAATESALIYAQSEDADLLTDEMFWYTKDQGDTPPVRNRAEETGATVKAANISLLEIRAALKIARNDNAGGCDDDLIRIVARMLGFKRVGSDLQERIALGL